MREIANQNKSEYEHFLLSGKWLVVNRERNEEDSMETDLQATKKMS